MKHKILISLLCICTINVYANDIKVNKASASFNNNPYPTYNLKQDTKWIDSLKRIIKKGLPHESPDDKHYMRKMMQYLKACNELGDYYTKIFSLKKINSMKTAILYYEKITNLGEGCDSELGHDEEPVAYRDKVCVKLADIYFTGNLLQKDIQKSFNLAWKGRNALKNSFEFYSMRYLGNKEQLYKQFQTVDIKDSIYNFIINPFALTNENKASDFKIYFAEIANLIRKNPAYNILITTTPGFIPSSETSQAYMHKFVEKCKNYFIEDEKISEEKIIINMDLLGEGCAYKQYDFPCLSITITSVD